MRSIVTLKVLVEHDEDFDCNELGVVWLMDDSIVGEYIPVLKDDSFNIIEYIEQEVQEVE